MNLDTSTRDACAQARSLWFVLAADAGLPELEDAIRLLRRQLRDTAESTSLLVLPQEAIAPSVADRLGLSAANHGSVLTPAGVFLLPHDRLFVMEDRALRLRPRDRAYRTSPAEHLLPSLIGHYRDRLHLLPLPGAALPEGELRSLIGTFGARIVTLDALRDTARPAPEAAKPSAARPQAVRTASAPPVLGMPAHLAHELRQPLQTATLLQGLLTRRIREPPASSLLERLGETLRLMADLIARPTPLPACGPMVRIPEEATLPETVETAEPRAAAEPMPATIYVIDDDRSVRDALKTVLKAEGCTVHDFESCEAFLAVYGGEIDGCLLVDAYLPGMSGIELLARLNRSTPALPAIMITGSSDVRTAVRAMKAGAADFIEKPVSTPELLAGIRQALASVRDNGAERSTRERAAHCLQALTRRQQQIMAMVLDGHPSKIIAADLGISQRTVENHRAAIMKKTGSRSLPALARLAMVVEGRVD